MIARSGTVRQFLRRSPTERSFLFKLALLFIAVHLLLRLYRLPVLRMHVRRLAESLRIHAADPQQLAWAVDRITERLPGRHSCLIQAVCCDAAAHASGMTAVLRIGAASGATRPHFHAWVEHEGIALTGDHEAEYAPLR